MIVIEHDWVVTSYVNGGGKMASPPATPHLSCPRYGWVVVFMWFKIRLGGGCGSKNSTSNSIPRQCLRLCVFGAQAGCNFSGFTCQKDTVGRVSQDTVAGVLNTVGCVFEYGWIVF